MDIVLYKEDEENPITLKADFILSLCDLILGGKDGLQPIEKTVIDRCVHLVYKDYLKDPRPENMPILQDLWERLEEQTEPEAKNLATALELYVTGCLNVFNNHTNIDITNCLNSQFDKSSMNCRTGHISNLSHVPPIVPTDEATLSSTISYSECFYAFLNIPLYGSCQNTC